MNVEGGVQEPARVLSCSHDNEERSCEAKSSLNPSKETGSGQKVKSLVGVCASKGSLLHINKATSVFRFL